MTRRHERGVVLLLVLFFALLLTSTVATFLRRSLIDSMIVRNREATSRAEALARGGIQLATALLLDDKIQDIAGGGMDTGEDVWAMVGGYELPAGDGATLRLRISDVGSRLNLNAVIQFDESGNPQPNVEPMLQQILEKIVEEIPLPPGEKVYDIPELVKNLIDWVDPDDQRIQGGGEDEFYQEQDPPYRATNQPLLSIDEIHRVEGFDGALVEGLRPYVTVYPLSGGGGINPNTAPPHVLSLLFFNDGVDFRLAPEDAVREILRVRQEGGRVCGEGQSSEGCVPMREIVPNEPYPPPSYATDLFEVVAEARVGNVRRSIEVVLDRGEQPPLWLSWRVL